jgi:hypothetical protein
VERKVNHLRQMTTIETIARRKTLTRAQIRIKNQQRESERLEYAARELDQLVEERRQLRAMAEAGTAPTPAFPRRAAGRGGGSGSSPSGGA